MINASYLFLQMKVMYYGSVDLGCIATLLTVPLA